MQRLVSASTQTCTLSVMKLQAGWTWEVPADHRMFNTSGSSTIRKRHAALEDLRISTTRRKHENADGNGVAALPSLCQSTVHDFNKRVALVSAGSASLRLLLPISRGDARLFEANVLCFPQAYFRVLGCLIARETLWTRPHSVGRYWWIRTNRTNGNRAWRSLNRFNFENPAKGQGLLGRAGGRACGNKARPRG